METKKIDEKFKSAKNCTRKHTASSVRLPILNEINPLRLNKCLTDPGVAMLPLGKECAD